MKMCRVQDGQMWRVGLSQAMWIAQPLLLAVAAVVVAFPHISHIQISCPFSRIFIEQPHFSFFLKMFIVGIHAFCGWEANSSSAQPKEKLQR